MSRIQGADAAALDAAGARLERAGVELRNRSRRLQRQVNSSPWQGRAADRFRNEFSSVHVRAMQQAAQFLDHAYEQLRREADQQREATRRGSEPGGLRYFDPSRLGVWLGRLPWWSWPDRNDSVHATPGLVSPRIPTHLFPSCTLGPVPPVTVLPDVRPVDVTQWLADLGIGVVICHWEPVRSRLGSSTPVII